MSNRIGPARLRAARTLLSSYPYGSFDIVLAALSELYGFKVTAVELGSAFQRAGLSSPDHYMAGAPSKHCETCKCR